MPSFYRVDVTVEGCDAQRELCYNESDTGAYADSADGVTGSASIALYFVRIDTKYPWNAYQRTAISLRREERSPVVLTSCGWITSRKLCEGQCCNGIDKRDHDQTID